MRMFTAVCSLVAIAVVTVGGCAANGTSSPIEEETALPTEPAAPSATLPPPSSPPSSVEDAGIKKDAGASDAGKPAPPASGAPCPKIDEIFERACGACGKQTALCFADNDGGAPRVSDYGPCLGEVAGGCIAGTVEDVACGNCGTQKRTCSAACKWFTAACQQPPGACKDGSVEYTVTGCPTPNTYRQRSCSGTCAWSAYTTCLAPANDLVVDVNATVAQTSTIQVMLSAGRMDSGVPSGGSCPASSLLAGNYPYTYVEVRNTTVKQAKVSMSTSTPAGGSYIYTVLAGYKVPFVPLGEDDRKACAFGPSSSLGNVVIEPGTSMLVYVRSSAVYNPTSPAQTTGALNVNVRTEGLL